MEQKENATPMEHVILTGQQVVGDTLKWIGFDLAVRVEELKSRIKVAFPSAYPYVPVLAPLAGTITARSS